MHARLLLGSLVQRASTSGVLDGEQIGVAIHALRQLNCLNVSSNRDLCRVISQIIDDADARSVANVLHALALSTREQCDPRVALSADLLGTLQTVQDSLSEVVDDLTAVESILSTEALLALSVYGRRDDTVVRARLMGELQSRAMSLAHVVERPVELLGILRIVLEAQRMSTPLPSQGSDGDALREGAAAHGAEEQDPFEGEEGNSCEGWPKALREGGERDSLREWSAEALGQILTTIEARLDSWRRQELISLFDVLTLGSDSFYLQPPRYGKKGIVGGSQQGGFILDATRPLIGNVLDRTAKMVPQLSPSQSAAWLTRLTNLSLAEHPLFGMVVRKMQAHLPKTTSSSETMSVSQLATSAISLSMVLQQQTREDTADYLARGVGGTSLLSQTDQDACLQLFVCLFRDLVAASDARQGKHNEANAKVNADAERTASRDARSDVLFLICAHLPERSLVDFFHRREGSLSRDDAALLQIFSNTLEAACSLLLRHHVELMPAELSRLACCVLHWHVFGGTVLPKTMDRTGSTIAAGFDVVLRFPPQIGPVSSLSLPDGSQRRIIEAERSGKSLRKLHALCGLLNQRLSQLNVLDILQLVNEAAAAMHVERGAASSMYTHQGSAESFTSALTPAERETKSPRQQQQQQPTAQALYTLAMVLHNELQRHFAESGIVAEASQQLQRRQRGRALKRRQSGSVSAEAHGTIAGAVASSSPPDSAAITAADLSTTHLSRYLSTLTKLNVRTVAEYYTVLHLLEGRTLGTADLLSLLYVVARHHLRAPYFVTGCVRRLPELADSLSASQKAFLLKYLGQGHCQRFVRAPCHPALEAGSFFRSAEELQSLTYLEAIFAFNGLMDLRQHENRSLRWLLSGPLEAYQGERDQRNRHRNRTVTTTNSNDDTPTSSSGRGESKAGSTVALPLSRTLDFVKSSTTLCEFVVSLSRLGVPVWVMAAHPSPCSSPHPGGEGTSSNSVAALTAQLILTKDAIRAAAHALTNTRSLFVDVGKLTVAWPILLSAPRLFCQSAEEGMPNLSAAERSALDRCVTAMTREWMQLFAIVQTQLQRRVRDIARDPALRPNTFLIGQLAGAVCFDALPDTVEEEERLFQNIELRKLPQLLGSSNRIVDAVIVAARAAQISVHVPAPDNTNRKPVPLAEALLAFVRKHIFSLRAQDILAVWWLCDQALQQQSSSSFLSGNALNASPKLSASGRRGGSDGAEPSRSPASQGQQQQQQASGEAVRNALRGIREAARTHFQDDRNVGKLSPLEGKVLEGLL